MFCFSIKTTYGGEAEPETPLVMTFPSTFRLERTNFVATSPSAGQFLSVDSLVGALRSSLAKANVDVLDYKPAHCVVSRVRFLSHEQQVKQDCNLSRERGPRRGLDTSYRLASYMPCSGSRVDDTCSAQGP